jgi:hypothetical protein
MIELKLYTKLIRKRSSIYGTGKTSQILLQAGLGGNLDLCKKEVYIQYS